MHLYVDKDGMLVYSLYGVYMMIIDGIFIEKCWLHT